MLDNTHERSELFVFQKEKDAALNETGLWVSTLQNERHVFPLNDKTLSRLK
jgi:hypothetical protein